MVVTLSYLNIQANVLYPFAYSMAFIKTAVSTMQVFGRTPCDRPQ